MVELKWVSDRYKVISRLGSGGSSRVYLAKDMKDPEQNPVAVKLLGSLSDGDRDLLRELYTREAQALSMLNHPRIVRLLDHGQDAESGILYLVLEYVERAETLRDRLPKWSPEPDQCLDLLIELLRAVKYAHQLHIIHRDLNPSNILMDSNGEAKIIDFGTSKILGNINEGQTVGDLYTRTYASPEQIAGRDATYASDIYSLAAVLYFMLGRQDPHPAKSLALQFDSLSTIPSPILRVAQRMASANLRERYQSAHQAMLALEAARDEMAGSSQILCVQITKNVVRSLGEQLVTRTQDSVEARNVVQKALY